MPTQLTLDEHLMALRDSGSALLAAAATAGLRAKVPTCPGWDVAKLVTHQGMVHRWAAANLRGERDHKTSKSRAEAEVAPDLLEWFSTGLDALVDTLTATAEDAKALVFLNDAPPPRRFWARRQAHETTIHSMDTVSAMLDRWPTAADVSIDPMLAADGIDELLTGFITRGKGDALSVTEPCTLLVSTEDIGRAWTLRIGDGPIVTTVGATENPDATFSGSAVQLYLSLWNRADEIRVTGPADLVTQWRSGIRIRWS
jgi:uncharacterized protein (TIGR03083 family)